MRLTFLGTGTSQGVPVIACHCGVCSSADGHDHRLRTSALLSVGDDDRTSPNILIDIGPDFRQQMLRQRVEHIDAILVTHAHRDHVAGLDEIRSFNYVQHSDMHLYLNTEAAHALQRDYRYIFAPHDYPGLPEAQLHVVDGPFEAAGVRVVPVRVMHKDLPILAFRIGKLGYITDANHIEPDEERKLQGVDTLVVNALRREHHWSHYSLDEALALVARLRPRRAYLTHVSHEMGLHAEVESVLPEGVHLAYDNLSIKI